MRNLCFYTNTRNILEAANDAIDTSKWTLDETNNEQEGLEWISELLNQYDWATEASENFSTHNIQF